jgi:hypothetical protein
VQHNLVVVRNAHVPLPGGIRVLRTRQVNGRQGLHVRISQQVMRLERGKTITAGHAKFQAEESQ